MPLNINWQQILLHLFNFAVLFGILYFLLYKPVKQFMDERIKYYENLDKEANENLAQAEKTKAEYDALLANADIEIENEKKIIQSEIDKQNEVKIKKAEEEAAKIIAQARKNSEDERNKILTAAQNEITDMVVAAAEKLIIPSTTSQAFDQFLDTAKGDKLNE